MATHILIASFSQVTFSRITLQKKEQIYFLYNGNLENQNIKYQIICAPS